MIFKRIGSACFAISFLLAIVFFFGYGSELIPRYFAKIGIILFGGIALLMNLISIRNDPDSDNNYIFWIGTAGIYTGLILKILGNPYNQNLLIISILVVAVSYFYNPFTKIDSSTDDELLDQ